MNDEIKSEFIESNYEYRIPTVPSEIDKYATNVVSYDMSSLFSLRMYSHRDFSSTDLL